MSVDQITKFMCLQRARGPCSIGTGLKCIYFTEVFTERPIFFSLGGGVHSLCDTFCLLKTMVD